MADVNELALVMVKGLLKMMNDEIITINVNVVHCSWPEAENVLTFVRFSNTTHDIIISSPK